MPDMHELVHSCRALLPSGRFEEMYFVRPSAAEKLLQEIKCLRAALADCMMYVDCDNLTQQTKHRNWQAVLDGKPWDRSNVKVQR